MSDRISIDAAKNIASAREVKQTQTNFNQKKFNIAEYANSVLPGLLSGQKILPEASQHAFGG